MGADGGPVEEFVVLGATGEAVPTGYMNVRCCAAAPRPTLGSMHDARLNINPVLGRLGVHGQGGAASLVLLPRPCKGQPLQAPAGALHNCTHLPAWLLSSQHVCRPPTSDGAICWLQFVNLRVLRLAQDDPLVWQRALLKAEVRRCTGCQWLQTPVCPHETVRQLTEASL